MRISVTEAKGQLTELVRRAEAGEEVVLTRHGRDAIRFAPIKPVQSLDERRRLLDSVQAAAAVTSASARSVSRAYETWGKGLHCGFR
jgi:prevent-host-death family protein